MNILVSELNLEIPQFRFLKTPASQIDKLENHFINFNYKFAILELFELNPASELNEKIFKVTRSSHGGAIGIKYDNKKKDGTYPKRKITNVESVLAAKIPNSHNESSISLNKEQAEVLSRIDNWISGDNPIAVISGRAGTGKTTLLKFIVKLLEKRNKTFSLLAPTGRAARVLSKKTGVVANTIHSAIYVLDINSLDISDDSEKQQIVFEESDFAVDFKLKSEENLYQIYIIDEASMVGDSSNAKGDLNFGTGSLLTDLLTQIGVIHRKNTNTKILFVGDPIQLPPIHESGSPALDKPYLMNKFKLKYIPEFYELKSVMRQAEDSLILNNAEIIRKHIIDRNFNSLNLYIDDVQVSKTNPISSQIEAINDDLANRIMVTHSNKTAHHYNRSIRSRIFKGKDVHQIQINDSIIVTNNSHKYSCYNGDIYSIVGLSSSEKIIVRLEKSDRFKSHPILVELLFRDITARPIEFKDDEKFDKKFKVIENLLFKSENSLDKSESISINVDWNNRIRSKNLTPDEKKLEFLTDPYINAVQIKFAYAITCHKAQGGEWPHVNIFLEGKPSTEEYYRWLYTAVTRATGTLSFVNASYLLPEEV
jgi:tRNA A37 threonylcarbamoyladenosine biosynthesis protein TsaE